MRTPIFACLILLFLLLNTANSYGQSSLEVAYASIKTEITDSATLALLISDDDAAIDLIMATAPVHVIVFIAVTDTVPVSDVHVKVGRIPGVFDVANNVVVPFYGTGCPSGVTKRREETGIYIDLGSFSNAAILYLTTWVSDASGNNSAVYQTTLN